MKFRRWLAMLLCPELEDREARYWYLWHQIDDVHKWCDGEARDVAQFLLGKDHDMWREAFTPPYDKVMPSRIDHFREWLYAKRLLTPSKEHAMSLMAAQRIKMLLILMDNYGCHRGLTVETIAKLTATEGQAHAILMDLAARGQAHGAARGGPELWYADPIYAEKEVEKFIPVDDRRKP